MAMSASPAEASGTSKTIVAQDDISQRAASLTSVPTGQETPRFSWTKPSGLKTATTISRTVIGAYFKDAPIVRSLQTLLAIPAAGMYGCPPTLGAAQAFRETLLP